MSTYRILEHGEQILPGDEWLDDRDGQWKARMSEHTETLCLATEEGGSHLPHRRKVEYPEHTPPAAPEGMKWEYRGTRWDKKGPLKFYGCPEPYEQKGHSDAEIPLGHQDIHYFEAVPVVNVEKFYEKMDEIANNASLLLAGGYLNNDPKGAAGSLKPQLQLIPTVAMREEAKALDDGRNKYGENNWRTNKVCVSTYIGAILRHVLAYRDGEDVDPESKSGVNHLGSVRACCAILLDAAANGTLVDDRPTNPDTTI